MPFTPAPVRSTYVVVLMLLLPLVLVVTLVFAAAARNYDGKDYTANGGVDATNGTIRVDDAWVEAPTGMTAGAHADLRLQLVNDSARGDALQGISTPVADHVRLILRGQPVRRFRLTPWSARNLEWSTPGTGLELVGVTRPLQPGQWFPVTFRFQRSRPITMQITAGPLAHGVRAS
jgi:copper(I)-binding protein